MKFERGSILRKEMLEDLYEYPRTALESYYARFSDGILYGLQWQEGAEGNGTHVILPGALKFHGKLYFLPESIQVEEVLQEQLKVDQKYRLCFVEGDVQRRIQEQSVYEMKLLALQAEAYREKQAKLFYYARVRCIKERLLERFDDGEVCGLFAAEDGYGYRLPDWVFEMHFKKLLEDKKEKHPLDYLLLKDGYREQGVSLSFIKMYLREADMSLEDAAFSDPYAVVKKMKAAIEVLRMKTMAAAALNESGSGGDGEESDLYSGGLL